jgi:hypothetical protein
MMCVVCSDVLLYLVMCLSVVCNDVCCIVMCVTVVCSDVCECCV